MSTEFANTYIDISTFIEYDFSILNSGTSNEEVLVLVLENLKIIFSKRFNFLFKKLSIANHSEIFENLIHSIKENIESNLNNSNILEISLELIFELLIYVDELYQNEDKNKYSILSQKSVSNIKFKN